MKLGFDFNIKKIMSFVVVSYLLILAFLFLFQRKLQYVPMGEVTEIATGFQEKTIVTEDGIKILSWFKKPKDGQKIILYFHGNAGNIGDRSHKLEAFAAANFGVMAISYRGYSKSGGTPSEVGLISDGRAAFKNILDLGYLPSDVILYGESLGSGVATQLAAKFDVAGVVLEAPYSSIASVAQRTYWFVPVFLLLKDKFESIKFAPKISAPVLIFHGNLDQIVPIAQGKKLFNSVKSRKVFIEVEGAGHLEFSDYLLVQEIKKFFFTKIEEGII